jgi:hypothetical protein
VGAIIPVVLIFYDLVNIYSALKIKNFRFLFSILKNFFCRHRAIGDPERSEITYYQTRGFPRMRE